MPMGSVEQIKDAAIIVSGGMDSITLLYEMRQRIALAISFDYGSNHNHREIPFAQEHCAKLGIEHVVIDMRFLGKHLKSALLEGDEAIPDGKYNGDNMSATVVPFRNGIMLAVAAGMAESRGLNTVMMANHGGHHTIYADCRPEFVEAFDKAVNTGTDVGMHLLAPYTNITKADIAARGKAMGIDYSRTWSCYRGGEHHCGRCATCLERREALRAAGVTDNTVYDD